MAFADVKIFDGVFKKATSLFWHMCSFHFADRMLLIFWWSFLETAWRPTDVYDCTHISYRCIKWLPMDIKSTDYFELLNDAYARNPFRSTYSHKRLLCGDKGWHYPRAPSVASRLPPNWLWQKGHLSVMPRWLDSLAPAPAPMPPFCPIANKYGYAH